MRTARDFFECLWLVLCCLGLCNKGAVFSYEVFEVADILEYLADKSGIDRVNNPVHNEEHDCLGDAVLDVLLNNVKYVVTSSLISSAVLWSFLFILLLLSMTILATSAYSLWEGVASAFLAVVAAAGTDLHSLG